MSKSSRRRKPQASRQALSEVRQELQENAPSAMPPKLIAEISQQITSEYRGPIPPPDMLAKYNEVIPNGAERILAMAEKQVDHRIDLEKTVVHGDARRSWWGLILGFLSTLVIASVGLVAVLNGYPTQGAAIITATVASLASVFVYGQWSRRTEREHKAALMAGRRK